MLCLPVQQQGLALTKDIQQQHVSLKADWKAIKGLWLESGQSAVCAAFCLFSGADVFYVLPFSKQPECMKTLCMWASIPPDWDKLVTSGGGRCVGLIPFWFPWLRSQRLQQDAAIPDADRLLSPTHAFNNALRSVTVLMVQCDADSLL